MGIINILDLENIGEIRPFVSSPETRVSDQKHIDMLMERADWKLLDAKIVETSEEKQGLDEKPYIEKSFAFAYIFGRKRK